DLPQMRGGLQRIDGKRSLAGKSTSIFQNPGVRRNEVKPQDGIFGISGRAPPPIAVFALNVI
ncbi:MAG: hypothetical protein IJG84_01740, partial [Kiritimatiellae bacterium]|nr:hypothetical protein [Kiritimatiellia bacterium]